MTEQKILINNLQINYKIAGSGPAILILHGWGSNSGKWQRVGELLAEKGFKVIIPDLPGFGQSQEPQFSWNLDNYCNFVEKFINLLNLERFFLVGHSFGGGLSVKYSLRFPEKIKKLFLIAAASIRKKTVKKQILARISKFFKIFSFIPFYQLFRKAFYKYIVRHSDYLYYEGIMGESYLKVIREDLSNVLSTIKVSTVIIWGEKDEVTPLKDAYLINEKIKNSKLIILADGTHDLEQKMPEVLAQKVLSEI